MILVVLWVLYFDFGGCDLICDFVGFWVFVAILFWLGFGRDGGRDLILAGFRQWCMVGGNELEKLWP